MHVYLERNPKYRVLGYKDTFFTKYQAYDFAAAKWIENKYRGCSAYSKEKSCLRLRLARYLQFRNEKGIIR